MSNEFLEATLQQIATGTYSPEELSTFLKAVDELDEAAFIQVYNRLYEIVARQEPGKIDERFRASLEDKLNKLPSSSSPKVVPLHAKRRWIRWVAAAAVLVLIAGAAYWLPRKNMQSAPVARKTINKIDVSPGGNHATLTLSNGSVIILDQAKDGDLARQGGSKIIKLDSGRLAYYQSVAANKEIEYNTISTPRAGQYHIILPDGTRVWLNSASSLRFPTAFSGNTREVQLTGEGYFEVIHKEKPAIPFIVDIGQAKITVLGTHFNINAYSDESTVNTTLLEGSIRFTAAGAAEKILIPGQQAVYDEQINSVSVKDADIEQVIAWKNGFFEFSNMNLPTIMRQISRWYDVDISMKVQYPDKRFGGRISRKLNLSSVIEMLETNGVHFKMENRTLTVVQ